MLHAKAGFHPERRALLNRKRMFVQVFQRARFGEVDDDVWAVGYFEAEGEDYYFAGVVWVADVFARAEAEGFFPFAEGFVVGVCCVC